MLHCLKLKWKWHCIGYSAKIIIISVASNLSFFTFNTKNNTNILHINIIYQPVEYNYFSKKRVIWMQGARHGFINGKQDVKVTEKHSVECIVLLTLWFIILSCLGRCNKRPSHNILFNRSIVHAISLHVSEVLFSGVVSAHILCAAPECRQWSIQAARNRRCSKIKQTNILLIGASVLQYINSI